MMSVYSLQNEVSHKLFLCIGRYTMILFPVNLLIFSKFVYQIWHTIQYMTYKCAVNAMHGLMPYKIYIVYTF